MNTNSAPLELALDTFGDASEDGGVLISQAQVIRNLAEQAILADELGSPPSVLASITALTLQFPRRK
jgi:hypothetical protein